MKDYRKLDLEELELIDYEVLIVALNITDLCLLEITEDYYEELMSKLEGNRDRLQYNNNLDKEVWKNDRYHKNLYWNKQRYLW